MDFFNKFSQGLAESSTPKSSIYYSEEKDLDIKKDEAIEIGLKSQESYYQRQLREQLARDNMMAASRQPIQPLQPTIHITPLQVPTPAPTPKPRQQQTNTSSDMSNLFDWLSADDNTQPSSLLPALTPINAVQDIISKFNKDQKTTTPPSTQPSQTLPTTTCTQQSDGSISCTTPTVTPPQPPIVATVCTPTPTGGTVCTTAQQNPNPGATSQQNLDNMALKDLMSSVEKDMHQLQAETNDLVTNVYDAREYTRRAIDQILQLVKGFERFQK
ncbi:39kDa core protein [Variola virus]|uniref:39kDa core protein OPG130 n=1 Tax=Variola virus TaxID=10255 RepID=Q0N5P5_VARV|nr:39kDa core protein [Variola virus]ABF23481.1 39kDa core protein [Variola virus]ABF24879.1 39kDa core protein [Variola virus]ABF26491.1 39kDa core protein [Variola virus]ABF27097.1 39kDa core protein [Variola virus]